MKTEIHLNNPDLLENNLSLGLTIEGNLVEVIRISKDGFFYKGEKIEDIHNVYERFNDWLKAAELKP